VIFRLDGGDVHVPQGGEATCFFCTISTASLQSNAIVYNTNRVYNTNTNSYNIMIKQHRTSHRNE